MQQAIDVAAEVGRKVAVIGRSMRKNLNIARNLDYVEAPDDILVRPVDLDDLPPERQLILCTGSQGEPLSALTRIAYNDHPAVKVERGDTVIISARAVPGNELRVHDAINRLTRERGRGAARGERARARLRATRAPRRCARCSACCGRRR